MQKRAAFEAKELSRDDLTTIENESIDKIVKVQTDAGFRAISDGEYRLAYPVLHNDDYADMTGAPCSGEHSSRNSRA